MQIDFLDRYSRLDSPLHRLPATLKFAAALALVVGLVLLPLSAFRVFGATAAGLLVVAVASHVPWSHLARRLILFEPFVLSVALLALWQRDGVRVFAGIVAKSTLCLFTMILLSNTTPFSELLRVLRRWRVPALLITTVALMYRYLFVLLDEAERMRRARVSRTFAGRRRRDWQLRASVLGQLFVRSSERAERIYAAMCARGWK